MSKTMTELHELTIDATATLIRKRQLSSVELTMALLKRIRELNPTLRAWVTVPEDMVLEDAKKRDIEMVTSGVRGPLHGIPIGLKDIFYTDGIETEAASDIYRGFVPDFDATSVMKLKNSGAVVIGKTVTTQFATLDPSEAINPWNPEHTPGGSSSGSAVAVAARMCGAALGSQTGGSTCRPASYNGIVGLKPTYGSISTFGVIPVSWSLDTVGILTRTVRDASIVLTSIAGCDSIAPTSAGIPSKNYLAELEKPIKQPTVGVVTNFFPELCDPEIITHRDMIVRQLTDAGASVKEVSLPDSFFDSYTAHRIIMFTECAAFHQAMHSQYPESYFPKLREIIETGTLIPGISYIQAQRLRNTIRKDLIEIVRGVDCLLMPTTRTPAPKDLTTTGDPIFQTPWTFAGLPTLTIPSGISKEGLPLGMQIATTPFEESKLLRLGEWIENVIEVHLSPPV